MNTEKFSQLPEDLNPSIANDFIVGLKDNGDGTFENVTFPVSAVALGMSGYSGISGYSGLSGFSGVSGSGVSGFSGQSGLSGLNGSAAFSGISGYSGLSGLSGLSGYSGDNPGSSGVSGFSGINGLSGTSGYSGTSGLSGVGTSGYSGFSGAATSGYSGYSGVSGISGLSGVSGTSGYSGFSGYSGNSTSGYSGFSGINGAAGTSGFSGYSGISGATGTSDSIVVKPGDSSTSSTGSFSDVANMNLSVDANGVYLVEAFVKYSTTQSAGALFAFNGPAGGTITFETNGYSQVNESTTGYDVNTGGFTNGLAGTFGLVYIAAIFINGANSGTLSLRFKNGGTGSNTVTVKANSCIKYKKIA